MSANLVIGFMVTASIMMVVVLLVMINMVKSMTEIYKRVLYLETKCDLVVEEVRDE